MLLQHSTCTSTGLPCRCGVDDHHHLDGHTVADKCPSICMIALLLQVVEFQSLGVRVRNTKRFFILNPTSITYDFVWAPVLPPAVAALGGPPPPSPFNCVVRKGAISEGR